MKPTVAKKTKARVPRRVRQGDVAPDQTAKGLERHAVVESTKSLQVSERVAAMDVLASDPSARTKAAMQRVLARHEPVYGKIPIHHDDELADDWEDGVYPYKNLMSRRNYETQKYRIQVELLKLQHWVRETGQKVVIFFEGRDAAGKGGTIKRFMEHLNPRGARVVALEKPSEQEKGEWYFQRYIRHLPSAGEIVLFDRSWYNRAGVEHVMGFCTDAEYLEFMQQAPVLEHMLVHSGIHLVKFWFSVSQDEQLRRFEERKAHPAQAVEALAHRPRVARQVGRVHQGQGGHVLLHGHGRCPVDRDQVGLQEARAAQRASVLAAPAAGARQEHEENRPARPAHRRPRGRRVRTR